MQKKLIALAVAGLASTAAFAQSNVTVYGIADVGYAYVDADGFKGLHNVNSGILSTSRLGFKGVEDLGNGLKALFTLEYGLTLDQNTGIGAGAAAARQQFVGLTGGFGTAVAGRLQTTGLDFTVASSALGGSNPIGAVNRVGGSTLVSAVSRANNAVAYISPSFGGVVVALNHARNPLAAEALVASGAATNNDYANLISASYDNGPISAGVVYSKLTVASTVAGDNVTEWGVRGGYDFGVAKLQGAYQEQDVDGANRDNKKFVVSVSAPVTAKIGVIGEYSKLYQGNTAAKDNVYSATLAGTYSLSKRTTAYAAVNTLNADGANNTVNTYGLGLRHSF